MKNNNRWSTLSMSERADLMNMYITNGISDLKEMKKHYNGIPYRDLNTSDYDYFNASPEMAPTKEGQHWNSRNPHTGRLLKGENHPTFDLMVEGENKAGYKIVRGYNGELYSIPNTLDNYVESYNSFGGEEDTNSENYTWKNIGSTVYDILELVDPTGISSYATSEGDLIQAVSDYKNGNGSIGNVALEVVGAIPLLGKVGKAIKLSKGVSKTEKLLQTANKVAKNAEKIDTFLELIPGVKKVATGTKAVTGTLLQGAADAMNMSSDTRKRMNIITTLLNNSNTIKDAVDIFKRDKKDTGKPDNNLEEKSAIDRSKYKSYFDATNIEKSLLPTKNGKYDMFSKKNNKDEYSHFQILEDRYKNLLPIMREEGFSNEEIERLTPFILTQFILEGGYVMDNDDNNFGGMLDPKTRKKLHFETEEDFYREYLRNLDKRWGDKYLGEGKGWRNAKTLEEYANIINREDLGLHTKEAWEEYNINNPNSPAFIYTPLWENNNTGLMSNAKFGGIKDRVFGLLELIKQREDAWYKFAEENNIKPGTQVPFDLIKKQS